MKKVIVSNNWTTSVNIKNSYPDIYMNLTTDNFALEAYRLYANFRDYPYSTSVYPTISSYNSSTGVLTMSGKNSITWSGGQLGTCTATVYIRIVMFYIE